MITVDMDVLRESHPRLFRTVTKDLDLHETSGQVDIDLHKLSQFTRGEVFGWLTQYEFNAKAAKRAATPPPAPEPAAPVVQEPQISMAELEAEQQADLKARADEAAAVARADQYVNEQGLESSDHNANAIKTWIGHNLKGYFSATGIDVAIQNLGPRGTNVLRWTPKTVAAPTSTPAKSVEVLGTLPNGEPQLPLNADQYVMRRASTKQLLDLNARRREASNQKIIGQGRGKNRLAISF